MTADSWDIGFLKFTLIFWYFSSINKNIVSILPDTSVYVLCIRKRSTSIRWLVREKLYFLCEKSLQLFFPFYYPLLLSGNENFKIFRLLSNNIYKYCKIVPDSRILKVYYHNYIISKVTWGPVYESWLTLATKTYHRERAG